MKLSRKRNSSGRGKRDFVVVARGVRRTEPDISRITRTSLDYYLTLPQHDEQTLGRPKPSRRLPSEPKTGDTNDAA